MLAPTGDGGQVGDRLGQGAGIEAQCGEGVQACGHRLWPLRPVPDEQTDAGAFGLAQLLAGEQAGDPGARAGAALAGLAVPVEAPVQLALQQQMGRCLRQVCGDRGDPRGVRRPVLAVAAVAAADQSVQVAVAVDQADRHAVHLGLHPQRLAAGDPARHGGAVGQLGQAGVRHGMGQRPGVAGQRRRMAGGGGEAAVPLRQAGAGLVVEVVVERTAAIAVVGAIPGGDALGQRLQLALGARRRPVGAGGEAGGGGREQQGEQEAAGHGRLRAAGVSTSLGAAPSGAVRRLAVRAA